MEYAAMLKARRLTAFHKHAQVAWARERISKTVSFWHQLILTDANSLTSMSLTDGLTIGTTRDLRSLCF